MCGPCVHTVWIHVSVAPGPLVFLSVLPAETGGICISPRPSEEGAEILPCMAMRPLFGIVPVLMDEKVSLPAHVPRHPLASSALPRRAAPTAGSPLRGESSGQLPLGHLSCSCLRPGSSENARWSLLLSPHLPGLQGNVLKGGDVSGALCLSQAWPGMARTIFGDHQRFMDAYFKAYPGEPFLPPLDSVSEPFPRGRGLRERSLLSLPLSQERSSSGFSQGLRPWAPRRRVGRHLGDNRGGSRPPPGLHVVVFPACVVSFGGSSRTRVPLGTDALQSQARQRHFWGSSSGLLVSSASRRSQPPAVWQPLCPLLAPA